MQWWSYFHRLICLIDKTFSRIFSKSFLRIVNFGLAVSCWWLVESSTIRFFLLSFCFIWCVQCPIWIELILRFLSEYFTKLFFFNSVFLLLTDCFKVSTSGLLVIYWSETWPLISTDDQILRQSSQKYLCFLFRSLFLNSKTQKWSKVDKKRHFYGINDFSPRLTMLW